MYIYINIYIHTEYIYIYIHTEKSNFFLFDVNGRRKFVFLGRQTIKGSCFSKRAEDTHGLS
jgi:hypothetical protein